MRTSEELFQQLYSSIKTRHGKECLQHVKDVCDMLERNKVKITPASVGRECEVKWGWPRAPSIRNSTNVHMAYLRLRQAEQGLERTDATKKNPAISDPTAIAVIRILQDKVRTLQHQFSLLKRLVYNLSPVDVDRIEAELAKNGAGSVSLQSVQQSNVQGLEESLKEMALLLLDEAHLSNFGLEIYNEHICQTNIHRIFLNKSCVTALHRIINSSPAGTSIVSKEESS